MGNKEETIKTYKGFDKDLKCRDFQYEVGKTYETDRAEICEEGFHAISPDASPLTAFDYYAPCEESGQSRYCEVEVSGDVDKGDDKICGKKITIGAEIGIPGLVKAHVEWVKEHIEKENTETNTGDRSAATNTGYRSAATNTGNRSAATNTGDQSAATNTGNQSAATNTGDQSAATNTGDQSAATNTGYQSAATNTGNRSAATNTGDQSAATNTGDQSAATNTGYQSAATNTGNQSAATSTGNQSAAEVSGKGSFAIATGYQSKVKGALGCAIVVAERGEWNGSDYHLLAVCSAIVDGKTIKADTWYTAKDGKLIEVE